MRQEIGKTFLKNMKIEILIFLILAFCAIIDVKRFMPLAVCTQWNIYFSEDRISNLSNFFSITIGIYLAIITLLATSVIGISEEILKKRIDFQLIIVLVFGMVENIIVVFLSVFADSQLMPHYSLYLSAAVITALVSFIKFIILIILIFIANMNRMAKVIDDENRYKEKLQSLLEDIVHNTEQK